MLPINLNYSIAILIFFIGLYITLASNSDFKKLVGMSIFQTAVLWFYISIAKIYGAIPPICKTSCELIYSFPLPHVLMLTAIVVGVTTFSLGLSLIIKMNSHE